MEIGYRYIEDFTRAAAECLQWQSTDAGDRGNGYPISDGGDEYTEEIAELVSEACEGFLESASGFLESDGIPASQAGHDFILSANGHGTGFWDRGYPHGDELHDIASGYSFDCEFMLWEDFPEHEDRDEHNGDEVAWLMAENVIIVNDVRVWQ